ncbi:Desumoylating isopeptidase 1 [Porphyridium purpureum]|uniref:Desumoylating isopeptidase 1 n=1 Tax=Porphyridium purpureum TaxID=35688 RepID=A0A5J4Z7Y7_PORPP|nr:Desumoylating isopeptidase 1 [Porphyridium purpureum]|eukprot:POR7758..scf295_1
MAERVILHVYDLSQGMARQMSPMLLGKVIDGIWHTGVEVFGREFYFGGGICADLPSCTPYGAPVQTIEMGITQKRADEFQMFLHSVQSTFSMETYHILDNNCNNFSDACCRFLLGKSIPQYILDLPNEAMNSPMGSMLRPMIENMSNQVRNASLGHQIDQGGRPGGQLAHPAGQMSQPPAVSSSTIRAEMEALARDPARHPVLLSRINRELVEKKLHELDPLVPNSTGGHPIAPDLLCEAYERLKHTPEKVFPVLDLLRVAALDGDHPSAESGHQWRSIARVARDAAQRFCGLADSFVPARMMTLRLLVNVFGPNQLLRAMLEQFDSKEEELKELFSVAVCSTLAMENVSTACAQTAACVAENLCGVPFRTSSNSVIRSLGEDVETQLIAAVGERLNRTQWSESRSIEVRHLLTALALLLLHSEHALLIAQTIELQVSSLFSESTVSDAAIRELALKCHRLLCG